MAEPLPDRALAHPRGAGPSDYERLVRFVLAPERRFALAVARYVDPVVRDGVMAEALKTAGSRGVQVVLLDLAGLSRDADLLERLATAARPPDHPAPDAIFVINFDHLLVDRTGAWHAAPAVEGLNRRRDLLPREVPARVVLWLSDAAADALAHGAWDTYDVVLTSFRFATGEERTGEASPGATVAVEPEERQRLRREAALLQRIYGDGEEVTRGAAEAAARLGQIHARQGDAAEGIKWLNRAIDMFAGIGDETAAGSARARRDDLIRSSRTIPVAFISSTAEDLRAYRAAARDAAIAAELLPRMMEYFVASGDTPPLPACLDKVSEADVLVVIVAHRYGWVPPDQAPGERKSITWLECERAVAEGKEVLAFVIDDEAPWPEEQREEYEIVKAVREGRATPELLATVQDHVARLREFKAWLGGGRIRASFTSPEDLRAKISDALRGWLMRRPEHAAATGPAERVAADPAKYLRALLARTAFIDIRGFQVGTGKAHRFPIDDLFVSLTTILTPRAPAKGSKTGDRADDSGLERRAPVPLHAALSEPRLIAVGDPGAGKTTFLRRVAHTLCEAILGGDPEAARARIGLEGRPFPILVRLADLATHMAAHRGTREAPATGESAAWLLHYLAAQDRDEAWGLGEAFFRAQLQRPSVLLLDGLDEAPDRRARASLARLIENVAATYPETRLVVTSRPAAYAGDAVLPGFAHVQIEPLDEGAVRTFLERWCQALWPESTAEAARHLEELVSALARPAIARMASNPVMLTALAVVHWNERRLPEQRADLYESVIKWLARQREQRPGRPTAERCVAVLQTLALAMQDHADGRQVQVAKRWAAEAIAHELGDRSKSARIAAAEQFLDAEELDSGIVVGRGNEVRFWHLTFQEFLAAKAIAARTEAEQRRILIEGGRKLYTPEWREVVLLLGGVLHGQGRPKVDGFISAVLDNLGPTPGLADEARCVGLLGAIARDLAPLRHAITDARYPKLLERVLAIFDATLSASMPIEVRIEAAEALGQAGDPRLGLDNPQRWVSVPAGTFLMGAQKSDRKGPNYDAEAEAAESPVHEVELGAYRIGRYPVTVSEYREFTEHGGYTDRRWWTAGGFGESESPEDWEEQLQFPNRPVVGVSWYEAMAFCAWAGCRLPTEAEWERAARGTEGRKFPWGNARPDATRLNYDANIGRPTPVGAYPRGATPDGIHDMAGNVWEWCLDGYVSYQTRDRRNPRGPTPGGKVRAVVRGGSWSGEARLARSAYRYYYSRPDNRLVLIGFRVVGAGGVRTP